MRAIFLAMSVLVIAQPCIAADCATLSSLMKERDSLIKTTQDWNKSNPYANIACIVLRNLEKTTTRAIAEAARVGQDCKIDPRLVPTMRQQLPGLAKFSADACALSGHYESDLVR